MKKTIKTLSCIALFAIALTSQAATINFDFTGRLVVADPNGMIVGPAYTPISATLSYNTVTGIGSSGLSITMSDFYLGQPATFHDITMVRQENSNLIDGQVLFDWNNNVDNVLNIQWDASGLFDAIDGGLQEWDVLSGSTLYHDANHNGVQDLGEFIRNIDSAIPYSDSLQLSIDDQQGPAPMAATVDSPPIPNGPFQGIYGYIDIGSGNSMHVTSVSAVPVPAAVWLFGSGLIGLVGFARRKKA
ncbi:MAG: VPLPA-CTERM sorting domain-containing protein [Gammaproteobacteria bacterium]|nr:VPLPA-CTERM sorting domain-containing protein [Gammaproteobacteria bacterium]